MKYLAVASTGAVVAATLAVIAYDVLHTIASFQHWDGE